MKMHGTLVSGKLDLSQYRAVSLRDTSNLHMLCNRRLSDITNNRTRRLSDVTPGRSADDDDDDNDNDDDYIGGIRSDPGLGRVPDPLGW